MNELEATVDSHFEDQRVVSQQELVNAFRRLALVFITDASNCAYHAERRDSVQLALALATAAAQLDPYAGAK